MYFSNKLLGDAASAQITDNLDSTLLQCDLEQTAQFF